MGIPKFFRWVSERYPLTSQLITPNSIPTFDNLYLDMNGIIHNCSHPPSSENDVHFRITEEQMILAIFAYIDHLFTKIKPKKTFFMAIDGVAPRAKMNQQRSRRFRTARDAKEKRAEAERRGEILPGDKAFDSNCITPGTPFMARLSAHLKYYVTKRISEDAEWRGVNIILSGHDVPGEGEHKIQEFIRLTKAQPDYNPNTRHCLYGLDADLIMLGLLSHDPHFCLLREEVTFGRKTKKSTGLAHTNFYLLHLSLLREYIDLEFSSLATQIPFEYDLERIIDDFILMGIFVGNDFLPHLPDLHINEGALERIWTIYKQVMPKAGGYLNEHGTISLPRLQLMLDELARFEVENFEEEFADQNWYKGKQQKEIDAMEKARKKGKIVITKDQQKLLNKIRSFVTKHQSKPTSNDRCTFVNTFSARDRRFLQELADSLHLHTTWDEVDDYGQSLVALTFDMEGVSEDGDGDVGEEANAEADQDAEDDGEDADEWSSEDDSEGDLAVQRVFQKYDKAKVVENVVDDFEESYEEKLKEKMTEWKRTYYKEKLEINYDDPRNLHEILFCYVEGLQWILNYYYKGVPSWSWFYKYHFSPKITDLKGIAEYKFDFDYGKPFTPFQQLMGVLPEESKEHVPSAYRDLMTEETSPIIDFYPQDFALDMNGKKQDWEAVVKIPFIDQARLLKAMAPRDARLTSEEKERNKGGVLSTLFFWDEDIETTYPSSLPGFFPDIVVSHCKQQPFHLPTLTDGVDLILGLLDGVHLGASALAGFPSLHTIPHHGTLGFHAVNVFQSDSRNQSMIITLDHQDRDKTGDIANQLVGKKTYHSWPYLQEGLVVAVSDDTYKYEPKQLTGKSPKVVATHHNPFQAISWKKAADHVEHHYSKRFGVIIGNVDIILHVRPLKGLKRLDTGALVKDYEGPEKEITQAYQLAVSHVTFEDERYLEKDAPPMAEEFPNGEKVIFMGSMAYGTAGQVVSTTSTSMDIGLAYFPSETRENAEFSRLVMTRPTSRYHPAPTLTRRLGISALALSRITSTLLVMLDDGSKTNIGLSLKFESKGMKVLGYTRRNDRGWEYSELAAQALEKYRAAFPGPFQNLDNRSGDIVTATELCPTSEDPDKVIKSMRAWLKQEGLVDLEPVSLFAEQLEKETVHLIEQFADTCRAQKTPGDIKRAVVKGIPRQAVLKPAHAAYRLQGQIFQLGDRVIMVVDAAAGGVPLALKGVVVGIGNRDIDVVWDVPFMGGETLNGRCSEYRGSTVPFTSCLNLTRPQFSVGANSAPTPVGQNAPFKPRFGPQPAVQMQNYHPAIAARHQAPTNGNGPIGSARNPARNHHPHNGQIRYGDAAKGVRPAPQQPAKMAHQGKLQSLLMGQARVLAAQQTARISGHGSQHIRPPQHVVKSPVRHTAALPTSPRSQNGVLDVTGLGRGGGRGGRGRGGARGRGSKGRGRAGPSVTAE
ncbi:putative exonuclease [Kockovaella imperatae]|uniref:5'-3' exoribonuclease 1 n=1 Tax=Kockovaella imperatae TaxID=4999 RepID=A0A1Y1ULX4_9TREE|nr:putative exonuclease [Kockovaella imperatae]ORX38527.1 putative exonuclease [Kockovaella imperatae]